MMANNPSGQYTFDSNHGHGAPSTFTISPTKRIPQAIPFGSPNPSTNNKRRHAPPIKRRPLPNMPSKPLPNRPLPAVGTSMGDSHSFCYTPTQRLPIAKPILHNHNSQGSNHHQHSRSMLPVLPKKKKQKKPSTPTLSTTNDTCTSPHTRSHSANVGLTLRHMTSADLGLSHPETIQEGTAFSFDTKSPSPQHSPQSSTSRNSRDRRTSSSAECMSQAGNAQTASYTYQHVPPAPMKDTPHDSVSYFFAPGTKHPIARVVDIDPNSKREDMYKHAPKEVKHSQPSSPLLVKHTHTLPQESKIDNDRMKELKHSHTPTLQQQQKEIFTHTDERMKEVKHAQPSAPLLVKHTHTLPQESKIDNDRMKELKRSHTPTLQQQQKEIFTHTDERMKEVKHAQPSAPLLVKHTHTLPQESKIDNDRMKELKRSHTPTLQQQKEIFNRRQLQDVPPPPPPPLQVVQDDDVPPPPPTIPRVRSCTENKDEILKSRTFKQMGGSCFIHKEDLQDTQQDSTSDTYESDDTLSNMVIGTPHVPHSASLSTKRKSSKKLRKKQKRHTMGEGGDHMERSKATRARQQAKKKKQRRVRNRSHRKSKSSNALTMPSLIEQSQSTNETQQRSTVAHEPEERKMQMNRKENEDWQIMGDLLFSIRHSLICRTHESEYNRYANEYQEPSKKKKKKQSAKDKKKDKNQRFKIRHLPDGSVEVEGLTKVLVSSDEDILKLNKIAKKNRSASATDMNAHSSRSHMLLVVYVHGINIPANIKYFGKLYLVDLAGSERVKKSGATGTALLEAQNINKSLSALGDVMQALQNKAKFIPYRNSTLTDLMANALGGNAKTIMFINCCPASAHAFETVSSLKFAKRVGKVELGQAKKNVKK
eukprot:504924_1